jgi:hypothetical protein
MTYKVQENKNEDRKSSPHGRCVSNFVRWFFLSRSDPFFRQASVPCVADDAKYGVGNPAPEADRPTYVFPVFLVPLI